MFLDYFALGLLVFVALVLFYGIIAIHDIPYEIAKHRNHPQQDAIHVAGWISLFTLHAIWPFLWIWAVNQRGKLTRFRGETASNIDHPLVSVTLQRFRWRSLGCYAWKRLPRSAVATWLTARPSVGLPAS